MEFLGAIGVSGDVVQFDFVGDGDEWWGIGEFDEGEGDWGIGLDDIDWEGGGDGEGRESECPEVGGEEEAWGEDRLAVLWVVVAGLGERFPEEVFVDEFGELGH